MQQQAIELIRKEKELLQEILQLTKEQAELLQTEQAQELLAAIQKRQQCIAGLAVIEEQLSQLAAWPVETGSLRQELQVLLQEVQGRDKCNRQAIAKKCGELKKMITSLHSGKGTSKAYHRSAAQPDGYFIDHKK